MNVSQQRILASKKAIYILVCPSESVTSRTTIMILPLCSVHLECYIQFWAPNNKRTFTCWSKSSGGHQDSQGWSTFYSEKLRDHPSALPLGALLLSTTTSSEDTEDMEPDSSEMYSDKTRFKRHKVECGKFQSDIRKI